MPEPVVATKDDKIVSAPSVALSFSLKRSNKGLLIKAQSDVFEDYFKDLSGGAVQTPPDPSLWSGIKAYKLPSPPVTIPNATLNRWGYELLQESSGGITVNASFLRAVGLKEGIVIEVPGVYHTDQLRQYAELITKAAHYLYVNFVMSVDIVVTVTTSLKEVRNG